MQPSDLSQIRTLSSPTVRPDGADVVFVVTRPDVDGNRYRSSLWRLDLTEKGSTPRRLTRSSYDSSPVYSPDGAWIAFVRGSKGGPGQVHVMPASGGDAWALTDQPLGAGSPVWSPDSSSIVYAARVPEEGRYGTDEDIKPDNEAPRLIEHAQYLADGLGYRLDRPSKLWLVELPSPEDRDNGGDGLGDDVDDVPDSVQLTTGGGDDRGAAFIDGGRRVAFVASRDGRGAWRPDTLVSDVCSVDLRGKGFRRHTDGTRSVGSIHVSPDGEVFVVSNDLGPSRQDFIAQEPVVHRLDRKTPLTDAQTDQLACAPVVLPGGRVVAAFEHRGDTVVRTVPEGKSAKGASGTVLLDGNVSVTALAGAGKGAAATVVAVAGTRTSYSELFVGPAEGPLTPRTDFARHLEQEPIEPEELDAISGDGYPVHGWLFRPPRSRSRKTRPQLHPVVLMIHGGPYTQYSGNLFDEAQVLARAGYAVVMGNPRGGSGYGAEHGRVLRHAIGTVDVADLMALLDHALALPGLDADRVGVQGGSYGGLMTTWLVAHSDRFSGAISERAVNAWDSFAGTSDIGWFFGDEYSGAYQVEQSPLTWADNITTPTLVIHSERDFRCPLEQGQRLFARLKRNGVPTKLLVFPGEGHELSRSGQPRHRVQRFEHILAWWDEHLR